jgi:WD40 repeat protein
MKLTAFLYLLCWLIILPTTQAQTDSQADTEIITTENVHELELQAQFGNGVFAGSLAWSADGSRLAIAGTLSIWLYDGTNLDAPPQAIPVSAPASRLAFSPDGETLGYFGDGAVHLLDLATQQVRLTLQDAYDYAFSPDGRSLAYITRKTAISIGYSLIWTTHLLDIEQNRDQILFEQEHVDRLASISFSPDGTLLSLSWLREDFLTCDAESAYTELWQVEPGASDLQPTTIWEAHYGYFNPDGSLLVSLERVEAMGNTGVINLWDVQRNQLYRLLEQDQSRGWTSSDFPVFHPTQPMVAFQNWGTTKQVQLWDTEQGSLLAQVELDEELIGLAYRPDGSTLVGITQDSISVWDGLSLELMQQVARPGTLYAAQLHPAGAGFLYHVPQGGVYFHSLEHGTYQLSTEPLAPDNLYLSEQGEGIAFRDSDGRVHVWRDGEETMLTGSFESMPTFNADVSLAVSHSDGRITLWNTLSGEPQATLPQTVSTPYIDFQFSPDNSMMLLRDPQSDELNVISLWDTATGELIHDIGIYAGRAEATFSQDNTRLAIFSQWNMFEPRLQSEVRIFDLVMLRESGYSTAFFLTDNTLLEVDITPDFQRILLATGDFSSLFVDVLDVTTGERHHLTYEGYGGGVAGVSADNNYAITSISSSNNCGGDYQAMTLWDLNEREAIVTFRTGDVSYNPAGDLLATTNPNVTIYEVRNGEERVSLLSERYFFTTHIQFTEDGGHLLTLDKDGTVRVWGIPDSAN